MKAGTRKIVQLPGTRCSPRTLLHQMLERAPEMDTVAVVWIGKDRFPHIAWSRMSMSDLTWCAAQLDDTARACRNGERPEDVVKPRA